MRKASLARRGPQLWVAMAFLLLLATSLSAKEIEDKKKERAEHPPKTASL